MNPRLPRMSWTAVLAVLVSLPVLSAANPREPIPAATGEAPCPAAAEAAVGEESTADLLRRGDREGRSGRLTEALEAWRKALQRRFPGFRKVPFLFPVEAEYMDKKALRGKLAEGIEKELPDEKVAAQQKALAVFGFIPRELDLKQAFLTLLTDQVAGFYDPDTKRLYLIRDAGGDGEEKKSWWQKLSGSGPDLDGQKMTLIHEMSHALMDQHHDLLSLQHSVEDDDDMALALSGLVEGEATLCMLAGEGGKGNEAILRTPPGFMGFYLNLIQPLLSFSGGKGFREAPRILRETLLFPYLQGLVFCLSLTAPTGLWSPVDAAFGGPPLSTEQILHPSKYRTDPPLAVSFPGVAEDLGAGWTEVTSNVLGELQLRILFSEKLPGAEGLRAAEGWGGDLFRVYERKTPDGGTGTLALAWTTLWDTAADAGEFRDAFSKVLTTRAGIEGSEGAGGIEGLPAGARVRAWRSGGAASAVIASERTVWVLQDIPEAGLSRVAARILKVEAKPKEFHLRKAKSAVEYSEERRIPSRRV